MAVMAKAMGYKNASSYQRYEDANAYTGGHLKRDLVARLDRVLRGKGQPPITSKEVWELAGPEFAEFRDVTYEPADPDTGDEYWDANASGFTRNNWQPKTPGALPELDIAAGAGEGAVGEVIVLPIGGGTVSAHAVVDEWPLPQSWLREAVESPKDTIVIPIIGDSMIPNYMPGDRVIVDLSQDTLRADGVYLLSYDMGPPQIKRLQRIPLTVPPKVAVKSDNESYDTFEVELDLLRIHGRVCAYVGRR